MYFALTMLKTFCTKEHGKDRISYLDKNSMRRKKLDLHDQPRLPINNLLLNLTDFFMFPDVVKFKSILSLSYMKPKPVSTNVQRNFAVRSEHIISKSRLFFGQCLNLNDFPAKRNKNQT